jgi:hypothetical protein
MNSVAGFKLTPPRALERQEQQALFQWAAIEARRDARLGLLFAIPNGTAASSMAEAALAKRTGRKKGVPDLFLPIPMSRKAHALDGSIVCKQFSGMFIEMNRKDGKPSDLSPEQRDWLASLEHQGYKTVVAYGWQAAANAISEYLCEVSSNE